MKTKIFDVYYQTSLVAHNVSVTDNANAKTELTQAFADQFEVSVESIRLVEN